MGSVVAPELNPPGYELESISPIHYQETPFFSVSDPVPYGWIRRIFIYHQFLR